MSLNELVIETRKFGPGESGVVRLNVGRLPSDTNITIQAHVFRGKKEGPTVLVLAGVHGDEINGIEIVRRILRRPLENEIDAGNLIIIPLLNIYGFINFDRYVPDGKDVNRSFPGTMNGSLASRIARTLTKFILPHVDYIFDFHTGGDSRFNYPQIRYSKLDKVAAELAMVFNPPMIIQSGLIPKSLRKTARDLNIPTLVYEAGESVRLNGEAIERGYSGLLNCLSHLGILDIDHKDQHESNPIVISKTTWLRASFAGIFIWIHNSGEHVTKGQVVGHINDPNGIKSVSVVAHKTGYIIGHNNASVVNHGDALFHIGYEIQESI